MKKTKTDIMEIGWREEIQIPSFTKRMFKAKIDTGARTSSLHVTNIKFIKKGRSDYVSFKVHPEQDSASPAFKCEAKVIEMRKIKSSTGHVTERPVIAVEMKLGTESFFSELTLINRDSVFVKDSMWIRAPSGGSMRSLKKAGDFINKNDVLALILDLFGKVKIEVRAPEKGIIIGRTRLPLINKGDALYHIATSKVLKQVNREIMDFQ